MIVFKQDLVKNESEFRSLPVTETFTLVGKEGLFGDGRILYKLRDIVSTNYGGGFNTISLDNGQAIYICPSEKVNVLNIEARIRGEND